MSSQPLKIAVVLDPRFPGGTASAVAQELPCLKQLGRVEIHGITSGMFKDKPVNPTLKTAIENARLELIWDAPVISADLILLHNPSFLKFDKSLSSRLVAQNLIVVTHENFATPNGSPAFDVDGCLDRIDDASLCVGRYLAPVSEYNRQTVKDWMADQTDWTLTPENWHNICDFELSPPTPAPKDRRGRHSRPGYEKFPSASTMDLTYPPHAEHNAILGADSLISDKTPAHLSLYKFRTRQVADFLSEIDFFVYFTNPGWRESFGRVIAEATAAGKLVITDPQTAKNFGEGIMGAEPADVNGLIAGLINDPHTYVQTVELAQKTLSKYGPQNFVQMASRMISQLETSSSKAAE